ncbi:hypothetical protein WJX84_003462 [Apatococcus fuscideae]|uniref:Guanylate cyclase domain-containing protein n=1 Tax=Apatococcus fuscideae TaxID=2026836 RepID=A0AAW1T2G4_9CHLO
MNLQPSRFGVHYYDASALLNCPAVVAQPSIADTLQTVQLDPYYYSYKRCQCDPGYTIRFSDDNAVPVCTARPENLSLRDIVGIALGAFFVLAFMVLAAICIFVCFWQRLEAYAWKRAKSRGPPGDGKSVTLVATDIEGSTELWEWNSAVADAAIRQHDQLIRTNVLKFYGHELTTEGDAFVVAFWEPADAVRFCIAVQKVPFLSGLIHDQALMAVLWPKPLLRFPPMAPCTLAGMSEQALKAVSPHIQAIHFADAQDQDVRQTASLSVDEERLFVGLRVRMSITTGKAELAGVKASTGESAAEISSPRNQYIGEVSQAVKALSNVTHGGQVLLDSATLLGLGRAREGILKEFSSPDPSTGNIKMYVLLLNPVCSFYASVMNRNAETTGYCMSLIGPAQ